MQTQTPIKKNLQASQQLRQAQLFLCSGQLVIAVLSLKQSLVLELSIFFFLINRIKVETYDIVT